MKITKLKKVRLDRCLTQEEVAQKSNLLVRTYQRYESGERIPNALTAQLIANAVDSTVEELFPLSKVP